MPRFLAWLGCTSVGCLLPGLALLATTTHAQSIAPCPIQLVDVTAASGITFRHHDGGSGEGYIVEGVSAGLATFDYDNDGFIDIYFLSGAPLVASQMNAAHAVEL